MSLTAKLVKKSKTIKIKSKKRKNTEPDNYYDSYSSSSYENKQQTKEKVKLQNNYSKERKWKSMKHTENHKRVSLEKIIK